MSKESRRRAIQRARQAEARRRRHRRLALGGGAAAVIALAIAVPLATAGGGPPGGTSAMTGRSTTADAPAPLTLAPLSSLGKLVPAPAPGPNGPEGVPVPRAAPLAGTSGKAEGRTVDGVGCDTSEQLVYHIHAHLTVFVNGRARAVPAGIGIPGAQAAQTPTGPFVESGRCFYWLHAHAADGIIHIESPVQRTYTLGDFFDEWGQPLSRTRVGPARGHVTALYDGRVYSGNPRGIPLSAHAQIQLEVGAPLVAPETITFPDGL